MTKFSHETCTKIIKAIEAGNTQKTAAALADVSETTFYRWLQRGKKAKTGKYCKFWESIKKAEEFSKAYHIQQIRLASEKGSWQASAWYLERRYPQEYGRRENVKMEHTGKLKQEVNVNVHNRIKEYNDYFDQLPESSDSRNDTG